MEFGGKLESAFDYYQVELCFLVTYINKLFSVSFHLYSHQ